jgi:hypothetical protein
MASQPQLNPAPAVSVMARKPSEIRFSRACLTRTKYLDPCSTATNAARCCHVRIVIERLRNEHTLGNALVQSGVTEGCFED